MPNRIKPKRSYTSNSVPLTTDLEVNELAIRWASDSPAIFTKNAAGQIVTVPLSGGSGGGGSSSLVTAATVAGFPATGSTANLYVATDTNRIYRWDSANSIYVELGPLASSGDTLLRSYLVPTAPTNVVGTAGNAQVSLTWTAATSLSQIPITDYLIQSSTDNGTTWTLASDTVSTATSATITQLTNGQAVRFRVAAVNGVGQGAWSSASASVTPTAAVVIDYLVVAGGGGGGSQYGGGGGAGGLLYLEGFAVTFGTQYTITVGGGGSPSGGNAQGADGSNSVFNLSTAIGGGGGGGFFSTPNGRPGGSGGGGGAPMANPGNTSGGSATQSNSGNAVGYGFGGGAGKRGPNVYGGGGGGAGSLGVDATDAAMGNGGIGRQYTAFAAATSTGDSGYFAGGGGGGGYKADQGIGGAGGGGKGARTGNPTHALLASTPGSPNTGGGGGGAADNELSQGDIASAGGSGIVILRAAGSVTAAATSGSPTRVESGGYTYYTFTGSGSITF